MAEVYFNSDINADGKIKLSTVPNATGTVITYNSTTKELSTRTNAQIISDLGLDGGLGAYVKKTGDTMSGALTMNSGVNTVINRDMSTITAGSGFARDMFRLTGTNGIADAMGWQGTVDSSGNITTFGYGYLGGSAYNVKNAIRWNANQQVRIGSTGVPGGSYALEVDGNTLTRGGFDSQNGYFNTVSGELLVQRLGVNRIRTNTASLILSGDTSNGIVYIRPQGDATAISEVQFRSNLSAVFPSTYNLYFGNQASEGGSIFHTNQANTTFGYGMWMNYNLQYDGTNFIQPRGSGVTSFAFTANQHKGFSFNVAPPNGTNGGIVSLTEVVRFGSSGTITTLNDGDSTQWNSAYVNGFVYKGVIVAGTDLNTITSAGWYVQATNANATTALNYPVANMAGHLRVYGGNATHLVQEYTTYSNNNDVYRRYYFNGTWSIWTKDWDTNDFTQVNVNSWNNIALNGATQQWVDQYYVNKSTQNIVKSADWFITDDFSAGMEGKIRFQNGMVKIGWGNMSALFSDEGAIDLTGYGIRQNDTTPNYFQGYTQFSSKAGFGVAQGTAPFDVVSSTMVPKLNADLLDGFHASDFVTGSQLDNYISKSPLQFRAVPDSKNAIGVDFYYSPSSDPSKPSGVVDGALLNMTYDNSLWNTQIYSDWRTNEWYVRVKSNGSWGDFQKLWHNGNFNPATLVPTSRTLTIDGVTQDLSANRTWTTNNTVTRLRGGGSFVSGDITISAGANVTVSQSGQTITVAATDTNTTYTAGAGITLTGTTFSVPVSTSGTGNGVASVANGIGGLFVTKANFALTTDLNGYLPITGGTLSGRVDIASSNGIGSWGSSSAASNYLTWRKWDNTGALAYIGGDGGGVVSDGNGLNFGIRAASGDLRLFSDTGNIFANNEIVASRPWVTNNFMPTSHPANGITAFDISQFRYYWGFGDIRQIKPSDVPINKIQFGFGSFGNDNNAPWSDWIHFGGFTNSTGGRQNLIAFNKSGFGMRQFQGTSQATTAYTDFVDYWHTGNFNPGNFVTLTGASQNISSPKTFSQTTNMNLVVDLNGGWMLGNDNNGGEYGLYDYQDAQTLIAGSENGYYVYGCEYGTYNGIIVNKSTRNVSIGGATNNNKLNVNGAVEASGLVSNSVPQSNTSAWTTDGGVFDLTAVSGKATHQYILEADSTGFVPSLPVNVDLISIFYKAGGTGGNSKVFLPKNSRTGQEVTIINNSNYGTIVCNQNTPLDILAIAPGDSIRLLFVLDTFPVGGSPAEDRVGDGVWVMTNYLKGIKVFS